MLKKVSYQTRFNGIVAIIVLIIMIISGCVIFYHTKYIWERELTSTTQESLQIIQARIEDEYKSMDDITRRLQASESFQEEVVKISDMEGNYFDSNPKTRQSINTLFLENIIGENLVSSLHYMSIYGDYYNVFLQIYPYTKHVFTEEEAENYLELTNDMLDQSYSTTWEPHEDFWTDSGKRVFSVIRVIRNNYEKFGILEMNKDIKVIEDACMLKDISDMYTVYISSKGKVVYQNREDTSDSNADLCESVLKDDLTQPKNDYKKMIWVVSKSDELGLEFTISRSTDEFNSRMKWFAMGIIGSYSLGFLVIMLFLRGITYKMIQPIRNLRDYLLNLTNEEAVPTSQLAYSKNEVEVLAGSIENLVLRIRENDRALEEAKRANLQAQINNLEAQINPHFLYNTLSVIGCIGIENGLEDVYVMCETLAELLRYSIRYENMMVPFGREIENIEQYLFLMKKRYEGGLEIEWNLDNTLDDIFIPKLVFQPIVENAFAHGFEMEKPPWNLVITTKKTENKWYFTVKNNGKPFDMAIYKKICSRMQSFQQNMECSMETEGYGLENTLMRLYYTYGENYSFEVTSEDGWVCIMIGGGLLGKEI